ncbi:MAG: hypothetical protein AAFP86_18605, partial [Planctomycetota bacterium]
MTSLVSYQHPGDEYGLYVVSNVLGMWGALLAGWAGAGILDAVMPAVAAVSGGLVVWGIGLLARRLG